MEPQTSFIKNSDRIVFTTENMTEFDAFKIKHNGVKIIGTHSGPFHADDVLATMFLKYLHIYSNSVIIRTRNQLILNQCDLVCDVGGEYNTTTLRFDHHMKEFNESYSDKFKIKLSSAGLVYKHYGKDIVISFLKAYKWYDNNVNHIDGIVLQLYKSFIMMVDAIDNGINQYQQPDLQPLFQNSTSYHCRVNRLNPEWNNPDASQDERFKLAQDVSEEEFYYALKYFATSYYQAYDIVRSAVEKRKQIDPSGAIIFIETGCPWKEILFTIETEMKIEGQILFVIVFQNKTQYNVSTVPVSLGNFKFRKGLCVEWRGTREEVLKAKSGFSDIVFVHSSGFCGAAEGFDTALKMVQRSLIEKETNTTSSSNK